MKFVALDFETADYGRDSACALGLVRVEGGRIVRREELLLRPPRREFVFTYLHGIAWEDVRDAPPFAAAWPQIQRFLAGADFLAAHSAHFDRGVLEACCARAGLAPPEHPFVCTVRLARKVWRPVSAKLPDVCRRLGLALDHHRALSDAEACAQIVLAALREEKGREFVRRQAETGGPAAARTRRPRRDATG